MRRPIVAGNWKMNGTMTDAKSLTAGVLDGLRQVHNVDVVVCPPFVYLSEIGKQLKGSAVALGAQNCSAEKNGAFTGEVAVAMLADVGCQYIIIGHSERRILYAEDSANVALKFTAVRAAGLIPILCVGERLEEREAGITETVVARQLDAVLDGEDITVFNQAIIAYEPVWAIGTGRTASPQQAQEIHAFIRARIARRDLQTAANVRILYGGSVKGSNAAELFAMPDIDGGLIGGASLNAQEFLAICASSSTLPRT